MLLSRKLDSAIGCIRNQLATMVKEIAEWIQHTWEYSSPIKEKFVLSVISRGVSLRRLELWRKITCGEPQLKDVSERTWRSWARELDNLDTRRKSETCSRANASRMNFGRTVHRGRSVCVSNWGDNIGDLQSQKKSNGRWLGTKAMGAGLGEVAI